MTETEMNFAISDMKEPFASLPALDGEGFYSDEGTNRSQGGVWVAVSLYEDNDKPKWVPLNWINLPVMLMTEMKKDGMMFIIESEPDYTDAAHIKRHSDAINAHSDYEVRLTWGDSNCHHQKPYDPEDGHGFTDLIIIGDSFGMAIAETYLKAHNRWKE